MQYECTKRGLLSSQVIQHIRSSSRHDFPPLILGPERVSERERVLTGKLALKSLLLSQKQQRESDVLSPRAKWNLISWLEKEEEEEEDSCRTTRYDLIHN